MISTEAVMFGRGANSSHPSVSLRPSGVMRILKAQTPFVALAATSATIPVENPKRSDG